MLAGIPDVQRVEGEGAALRMFAYGCLAASLLLNTKAPASLVWLYAAACLGPALISYARTVRQRNGDEDPHWMKAAAAPYPGDRRAFRQRLTQSPFAGPGGEAPLADRIADAAELCVAYGRRAIVVSLTFDSLDHERIDAIAEAIRRTVRKTDLVEVVSEAEILVGLAMVHDFAAAEIVTERIRVALEALGACRPDQVSSGASIYPLHGYSGDELICAARSRSQRWSPPRLAA